MYNLDDLDDLKIRLSKAQHMLEYWHDKDAAFWATWKGLPKNQILNNWKLSIRIIENRMDQK